jgi:DNA-binding NtrC family response regulator
MEANRPQAPACVKQARGNVGAVVEHIKAAQEKLALAQAEAEALPGANWFYLPGKSLEALEAAAIRSSFERNAGNRRRMKGELGLSKSSLLRKLDELSLRRPEETSRASRAGASALRSPACRARRRCGLAREIGRPWTARRARGA